MSSFHSHRGYRNNGRNTSGCRTEYVVVPAKACGLIVGKGGRNIKELQQLAGIRHISVDFSSGRVKIVGNENGIAVVKQRIGQAALVAAKSDHGHFPEATLSFILLNNYSAIKFQPLSAHCNYAVRTEQLDANRKYFTFNSLDVKVETQLEKLTLTENKKEVSQTKLVGGFDSSVFTTFFDKIIRRNLPDLCNSLVKASIYVNFGKTFVSSVPANHRASTLTLDEVNEIGYGKIGLRPEFVRNFSSDKHRKLLNSIKDDYVKLQSGKFIVVYCTNQRTKKGHTIKLRMKDDNVTPNHVSGMIKKISGANTYFSVLGLAESASNRDIKIAFRRIAVKVHPDKNTDNSAEKAMQVVNEAFQCLRDDAKRAAYLRLPPSEQRPKNRFTYVDAVAEPFPEVESFTSGSRRLGLCTLLKATPQGEFRTTIETHKEEDKVDRSMLLKLQKAWNERSHDGKMRFPTGDNEWLVVDTVSYEQRAEFTNGNFLLGIKEVTEDRSFASSCNGVNVSLESHESIDSLKSLTNSNVEDSTTCRLLSQILNLHREAEKILSSLDA